MLTYNMDVRPDSVWLRATLSTEAQAQPYHCTEAGLFFGGPRFATARTDKESYLLFYTIAGAGLIEQNDQQLLLPAGRALLLDCRTPQSYCTAPRHSRWHHYWVHLDGTGVAAAARLLLAQNRLLPVTLPQMEAKAGFEEVLQGFEEGGTVAQRLRAGLALHTLLTSMACAHLSDSACATNRQLVEQAAAHIRRHYAQPLTLDELLANTHLSKSYFLRLFRQYMGATPYNYLLTTRITQAKELLVATSLPVGEIARRVGFGDESNFSTRFSAMVGQSPLQYRKSSIYQGRR